MKRETIIAIGMGILLGVGIGFYVLFQSRNATQTKVIPVTGDTQNKKIVKNIIPSSEKILKVSPATGTIVNIGKVQIKGEAQKGSLIVLQSAITNTVYKNESGDFSISVPLALGENAISISAYGKTGSTQEMELLIYYIKE